MLDSVSNFATLFRHALLTMGQKTPKTKREVIEQLALGVQFDPSPFLELLQVREGKSPAKVSMHRACSPDICTGSIG